MLKLLSRRYWGQMALVVGYLRTNSSPVVTTRIDDALLRQVGVHVVEGRVEKSGDGPVAVSVGVYAREKPLIVLSLFEVLRSPGHG